MGWSGKWLIEICATNFRVSLSEKFVKQMSGVPAQIVKAHEISCRKVQHTGLFDPDSNALTIASSLFLNYPWSKSSLFGFKRRLLAEQQSRWFTVES